MDKITAAKKLIETEVKTQNMVAIRKLVAEKYNLGLYHEPKGDSAGLRGYHSRMSESADYYELWSMRAGNYIKRVAQFYI